MTHRAIMKLLSVGVAALLLAGCADATIASSTSGNAESAAPTVQILASEIATIEDGFTWARSLDNSVTAEELSKGVTAIGELVPGENIWFASNNEIGRDLISLNIDVLNDPENAGAKVDDLLVIVDKIEAAIEHGNKP